MRQGYRVTFIILALLAMTSTDLTSANGQVNSSSSSSTVTDQQPKHSSSKTFKVGNTIYKIEPQKSEVRHLTQSQIKTDLHQMRTQTLHDIKVERAQHLSTPIKVNRKLNRLAMIRAQQVSHHFSHYDQNHRPMTSVDAHRAKLPRGFQGSENIASSSLGECTEIADPKTYHNHNGRDMANMSNDGMMHYDEFEQNGHRKNILSSSNTLVGIGAAYNAKKRTFYLAEDFGNTDGRSSEAVDKASKISVHLKSGHHSSFKRWVHRVVTWCQNRVKNLKTLV